MEDLFLGYRVAKRIQVDFILQLRNLIRMLGPQSHLAHAPRDIERSKLF